MEEKSCHMRFAEGKKNKSVGNKMPMKKGRSGTSSEIEVEPLNSNRVGTIDQRVWNIESMNEQSMVKTVIRLEVSTKEQLHGRP